MDGTHYAVHAAKLGLSIAHPHRQYALIILHHVANCAIALRRAGEPESALSLRSLQEMLAETIGRKDQSADSLLGQGHALIDMKKYEDAERAFRQGLELAKISNNPTLQAYILDDLA